jgi:radical SAM superfamily enzyme YgiQ (UPF0313 family)
MLKGHRQGSRHPVRYEKGLSMRILLVSVNRERIPYPVLPIGVCAVASALKEAGHEVRVEDLCFGRSPLTRVRRAIRDHGPDLVGIALRNMDNCDATLPRDLLPEAREIVSACRGATSVPILIGGAAVGVMPEEILLEMGADLAVVGDGEITTVKLVAALAAGDDPAGIPGVCVRRGDEACLTPPRLESTGIPPVWPRIHEWIDIRPYVRHEGAYPIQTKRGCALFCVYCTYVNIEGRRYRNRTGEDVASEIEEIYRRTGVHEFEFVDSTFNAPPHHALEVCRALKDRNLPVRFIGNGLNPVATTPELLEAMVEAGCHALVSTPESASDPVLLGLRKGFDRHHLEKVARATRETGLPSLWIFLLGGPGETLATVRETLDFIHTETGPRDVSFVASGLRIYPGTPLETIARDQGFITSRSELLRPCFYFSPGLERTEMRTVLHQAARRDPRIVTSEVSQGPLVPFGLRVLSALRFRRPLWRFSPLLNRALRVVR